MDDSSNGAVTFKTHTLLFGRLSPAFSCSFHFDLSCCFVRRNAHGHINISPLSLVPCCTFSELHTVHAYAQRLVKQLFLFAVLLLKQHEHHKQSMISCNQQGCTHVHGGSIETTTFVSKKHNHTCIQISESLISTVI